MSPASSAAPVTPPPPASVAAGGTIKAQLNATALAALGRQNTDDLEAQDG